MEKQYKYKVIIPNPDKENETIEKLLQEKVDVLNFLEINSNTFQRIYIVFDKIYITYQILDIDGEYAFGQNNQIFTLIISIFALFTECL